LKKSWSKDLGQTGKQANKLDRVVKKSTKSTGRSFLKLNSKDMKRFGKGWKKSLNGAGNDSGRLVKSVQTDTSRVANQFKALRTWPLSRFSKDWRTRFRSKAPSDVGEFRKRVGSHMGGTADTVRKTWADRIRPTLVTFGKFPKQEVAPRFKTGVEAIAGQWAKVQKAMAKPVKFTVE